MSPDTRCEWAVEHGVFLVFVRGQPKASDIEGVMRQIPSARGAVGYLQIFDAGTAFHEPSPDERRAWIALAEQAKRHLSAGALVVLREGFGGAALRAAISGIMLLAKGSAPSKVFGSAEEAARWLVERKACTGGAVDVARAAAALAAR